MMSGRAPISLALVLVGASLVLSCARPNYVTVQSGGPETTPNQKGTSCTVQFKKSSNCLNWSWEKPATSQSMGTLIFKVERPNFWDGSPVVFDLSHSPALVLWMPGMGHGSKATRVTRLDVGTYRVQNVFFNMPGDWQMKFQERDGDQVVDEAIVELKR